MKKYIKGIISVILAALVFALPAAAAESCDYATDGKACEIWWFYDDENHWQACVTHENEYREDAPVSEPEPHEYEDGYCKICNYEETKGNAMITSWLVFAIVAGLALMIIMTREKLDLDKGPFGMDKFKRRPY